jgi:quinol monooxygenase YgiN
MSYVVIAKWTALEGEQDAVAAAISRLIEPSRAEPGNISYHCHRDPEDDRVFLLYEQYIDEEAYASHGRSQHFQKYAVNDGIPRLSSRERAFYMTWEGD